MQELDDRKKSAIQTAKLTSLGEMASGIAHEINNPLAVISTRATQLRRQIERGQYDPEAFKASLLRINQTVDRIAKIIRGLKSFSRNAEQDAFDAVPLKSIVENTLELCNEKFRHQRVLLKVDTVPEAVLYCREAQLVQVLLNLLSNAYDAVERLDDRWTHVSFSIDQNEILSIMVTDSGEGIPEKIAQDIMQPFFSTKEVGKGTGLGLSISKGIIEDHKGNFYLDQKSKNTRFVIELPVSIAVSIHSEEPRAS
jgi:C4-dicarboxylate-specific signal transduction histidine kinase